MYQLYVIEFPNGKRYFGITARSAAERWRDHHKAARRLEGRPVCKALRKYPAATFRTLVFGHKAYIENLEARAIEAFDTTDRRHGYNFGKGGDFNPMDGKTHTEEARAKISAAGRGRIRSEESKAKTSATLKGRPISAERRAKISAATKIAMANPDVKARMLAARRISRSIVKGFS